MTRAYTVSAVVLLGILSGRASGSGDRGSWFRGLAKPRWLPPGGTFAVVWITLHVPTAWHWRG